MSKLQAQMRQAGLLSFFHHPAHPLPETAPALHVSSEVGQSRLPSPRPDLPTRYLCHVLPGRQGPRRRLCSHRRRPVSLVASTCLCLMSPDTLASTLLRKLLAFATLSLSSKPTYIPTSVPPSVVQQTLSAPRRNSWTLIQNPHPQLSLAPRPLEASTQGPPVPLLTSRWFVLPPYGLPFLT